MRLSEKILFLRKREGMSQEDLASQLNVSRQTVYKWESDASTPEIEKIKQLATLFNVSFDYLLNDNIVSVEINKAQEEKKEALNKEEPKVPLKEKYRFVFNSNIPMAYRQAELDHGYTESRNNKIPYSEYLFTNRCSQMNKAIKSIGANKSILLQGDLAGCFFENTKDMFFGFYYGGNIQFICPFENFISVHLSDSGSRMSYGHQLATGVGFGSNGIGSVGVVSVAQPRLDNARSYTLIVTYFNKSGNRSEFKLNLNCSRIYPIYERKHVEDVPIIENLESDFTRQRLNEICAVMSSYPVIAKKIADGEVEVKEIKITDIQARIKRAAEDEEEYNNQIEEWTEKDKKRRRIIILSIIAAIVAVILYFMISNA